jgi:capsular exopolysaccharide synthesis family protein
MNPQQLLYNSTDAKARSVARLNRYRELLIRKWKWLACGLLLGLLTGLSLWCFQPAAFLSIGRMIVSIKLAIPEGSVYSEELGNFLGTQAALMQSRVVIERAQARLAMRESDLPAEPAGLRVSVSPKTSIFVLEAGGSNGKYLQAFLQVVMEEYIKLKKEMRAQTSDTTVTGLTEQVLRLEKELRGCQQDMLLFQRSNSVVLLQEQGNIAGNYLASIHQRLAALEAENVLLQSLTANQIADPDQECAPAPLVVSNPGAETSAFSQRTDAFNSDCLKARQQLLLFKAEQRELGQYLRSRHPKMIALSEEIARCERLLEILRRQSAEQLESRKASLARQIAGLQQHIEQWNNKALEISQRSADYQRLRANEQRVQALYDRLLGTLQTLDVNKEISPESVTLLEPASPPFSDFRKPLRQLITSAVVALVLSIALVLFVDHVDDRVNSFTEVQHWFTEPVLVQIPRQEPQTGNLLIPLVGKNDLRYAFAEAYRSLRSSLLYLTREGTRPKTLVLTSAIPNEGKSLTASNLAITLAQADARVLLVDADLRKGTLHKRFGVASQCGLAEVLTRLCPWHKAIIPTDYGNLFLLPRGALTISSSDVFIKQSAREFLKEIASAYDYVILDTPPVMAADDVASLAPQADAVLFVLRAEHTSAQIACAALDVLYRRQVRVLGIIFNAVRRSNADCYSYGAYQNSCVPGTDGKVGDQTQQARGNYDQCGF